MGDEFSAKEIMMSFMEDSKKRDDAQDEKIEKLMKEMAEVKTNGKWLATIAGAISGLLSSFGHGFLK